MKAYESRKSTYAFSRGAGKTPQPKTKKIGIRKRNLLDNARVIDALLCDRPLRTPGSATENLK